MQAKNSSVKLLSWYDKNHRVLPFRLTKDPYKIWVSEIMLQQTQIKTVIPYYNKWIKTFPTLIDVAKSNISILLKNWEGLGYYSRCINFHKSAKIVLDKGNTTEKIIAVRADQLAHNKIDLLKKTIFFFP